jgi:hypothetical protein
MSFLKRARPKPPEYTAVETHFLLPGPNGFSKYISMELRLSPEVAKALAELPENYSFVNTLDTIDA